MAVIVYLTIGLVAIILQTTLFMFTPMWLATPDFHFILIAYLAYRFDLLRSLLVILPLGWCYDIVSGTVGGMHLTIYTGSFLLLKFISTRLPVRESLYQIPLIGVSYLLMTRLVHGLVSFFSPETLLPWSWPKVLVRTFLILLIAIPLFRFFEVITKWLEGRFTPLQVFKVRSGNRFR